LVVSDSALITDMEVSELGVMTIVLSLVLIPRVAYPTWSVKWFVPNISTRINDITAIIFLFDFLGASGLAFTVSVVIVCLDLLDLLVIV